MAQFAPRTARGLARWLLMVFLAFTLTMLHLSEDISLKEAAWPFALCSQELRVPLFPVPV